MILSSHIVVASAAAAPFLNTPLTLPKAAAILGIAVLSHYAIDAIPHWDYVLSSVVKKDDNSGPGSREFSPQRGLFLLDLGKAAVDGLIGVAVAFVMMNLSLNLKDLVMLLWVSAAAVLPDVATMLYIIFPRAPFSWFHKAHIVHTKYRWKKHWFWGALLQVAAVAIIVFALRAIFRFW